MQLTKYAAVAVIAFVVSMLFTAKMIPVMKEKQFGQKSLLPVCLSHRQ